MNNITVICNEEHVITLGVCAFCERDRLYAEVRKLREALIWCSAAQEFSPEGAARQGWLTVCAPLFQPLEIEAGLHNPPPPGGAIKETR